MNLLDFIRDNENWKDLISEKPYSIKVVENEKYILLKYNQIESDFNLEIVRECRGIILDNSLNVVCRPFDKFGNYGEGYAPEIDWESARVQEKIDGSIIKVWFHDGDWHVSTNGSINAFETDLPLAMHGLDTFGQAFDLAFLGQREMSYDNLNKDYTYMFELVGPYNKVVVPYEKLDVYHIGTRHTLSGEEMIADIGLQRPKEYPLHSLDEVLAAAEALPFNEEGYVVVDKYWNRVKIKSPAYVAVHHLKGEGAVSPKRVVKLIMMNESMEFLNYFPEYQEIFSEVEEKYNEFIFSLEKDLDEAKSFSYEDRKEFAMWAKNKRIPALLFQWLDGKIQSVEDWILDQNEEKISKHLGYK